MLDPAHLNLTRYIVEIIVGGLVLWFLVMLFYFYVCERRKLRR